MKTELETLKKMRHDLMAMTERYSARGCVEATKITSQIIAFVSDLIVDVELLETIDREFEEDRGAAA